MRKLSDQPGSRWPAGRPLGEDAGRWWVLRVKPRNEKALADQLALVDVGYFLPLMTKRSVRRDNSKTRKSVVCLFPGYLPVVDYPAHRLEILRTGRVAGALEVRDQERFVRELEGIQRALERLEDVEVHPELAVGQPVLLLTEAMRGVQGVVVDSSDRGRVYLNVQMFQRSIVVRVPPAQVIAADDPRAALLLQGA